jgi:SDR family mycofactocin-dependent oxidoreductase
MRIAVVTGAARGIGAATVHFLAGRGWGVIAVDRCEDDPSVPYSLATRDDLAAVVKPYETVAPLIGDVRDPLTSHKAVELAVERFGGLDAAVAAASVIVGGRAFWESDPAELDVLFDVDFRGVTNLARAAIPALLSRPVPRHGRFVAVASAGAHTGLPGLTGYCAAKHAVLGLVRGLADDLAATGVTATAVSPGSTRTAMLGATAAIYGLESVEELAQHQSLGRLIEPEEVAAAIGWAVSEESSAMTGAVLRADGGFHG